MEEAKTILLDTITKINTTAREQFEATFAAVEKNFSHLFEQLFEGGQAQVALEAPDDPLESPISVMARPRGKKPVTILQLSGGERALTAIALLFALYMVKPSPFCILDEIDAPLDDANIGRFIHMLGRFSRDTQFIIITHNKMTMEAVDVLYGVTMQSPGISRLVSVRLNEALEAAGTPA
jgi:chromosome segregation protein